MKQIIILGVSFFMSCASISYMKQKSIVSHRGAMPVTFTPIQKGIWVIGHRGASEFAPENTIPSFDLAHSQNAHMIEFDVMFTKDHVPIIIHDDTLDRTTNGRGPIAKKTWSEIYQLDAGLWKNSRYRDTHIPTLEEVLKRYKDKIAMNIEVKKECLDVPGLTRTKIAEYLLLFIEKAKVQNQVLFSSFDHGIINEIRKQSRTIPVAYLTESGDDIDLETLVTKKIDAWNAYWEDLNEGIVNDFRSRGLLVYAWGTNHPDDLAQLIRMGVSGVFVDNPMQFKKLIAESRRDH